MRMRADERIFVDTNVLLYSVDPVDAAKQMQARDWIEDLWQSGSGRLSWQVLNEFYANAVRKIGARTSVARATVDAFAAWKPVEQSLMLVQRAWYWTDEAKLSYWDGLILAAAERAGCQWLLSEDFQAGRKYGSVRVIDPFLEPPRQLRRYQ
jgi:predicted nucleic acid-binding protein